MKNNIKNSIKNSNQTCLLSNLESRSARASVVAGIRNIINHQSSIINQRSVQVQRDT